jgi:hypothetical protein
MQQAKPTVIIGASDHSNRYSYLAANRLVAFGHTIFPLGIRQGRVAGTDIINSRPPLQGIDTVTLYINPSRQPDWYGYIIGLSPRRVIFNPGTENDAFADLLRASGIEALEACTLVLLSTGQY